VIKVKTVSKALQFGKTYPKHERLMGKENLHRNESLYLLFRTPRLSIQAK
jgi:hypothetical protein